MHSKGRRRQRDFVYRPMTGVQTDFCTLLKRFMDTGSVRYEKFAELWRASKMPLIFSGRQTDAEAREFTENCFDIAKAFLFGAGGFQTTVGGLYLLYAIYFKQLFEPKAKIRITLDEWAQLHKMLDVAGKEFHYDVEYIFWKLRYNNAFHYSAYPTLQSGLQPSSIDNSQEVAAQSKYQSSRPESLLQDQGVISELTDSDAIDQLKAIHEQYHRVKCAMGGPEATEPQPSLSMIDSRVVEQLTKRIKQFESWKRHKINKTTARNYPDDIMVTSESGEDSESDKEMSRTQNSKTKNIGIVRAAIKAKAMGFSTEPSRPRHREMTSLLHSSPSKRSTAYGSSQTSEDELNTSQHVDVDVTASEEGSLLSMPDFTDLEETKKVKGKTCVGKKSGNCAERKEKSPGVKRKPKKSLTPNKSPRKAKNDEKLSTSRKLCEEEGSSKLSHAKRRKISEDVEVRLEEQVAAESQEFMMTSQETLDYEEVKGKGHSKRSTRGRGQPRVTKGKH